MIVSILRELCQICDGDNAFLNIYNAEVTRFKRMFSVDKNGLVNDPHKDNSFLISEQVVESLRLTGFLVVNDMDKLDDPQLIYIMGLYHMKSYILYPVWINGILIGSLGVSHYKKRYFDGSIHLLFEEFSLKISKALENEFNTINSSTNSNLYQQFFNFFNEPTAIINNEYNIIDMNHAFEDMFNLYYNEVIFQNFFDVFSTFKQPDVMACFEQARDKKIGEVELLRVVDEKKHILLLKVFTIHEDHHIFYGVIISDVTQKKMDHIKLDKMAFFDLDTSLRNQNYVNLMINHSDKLEVSTLGVVLYDIVNLKAINMRYGEAQGDLIIKQTATMLSDVFSSEYLCARVGGDDFMVIFVNKDKKYIENKCHKFSIKIEECMTNLDIPIQLNSGSAFTSENQIDWVSLIDEANKAIKNISRQ